MQDPVAADDPSMARSPDVEVALAFVRHAAGAERMAATAGRILDFAAGHPDVLHRTCRDGHLTGSALLVDHRAEHTLVLHHTKLRKWLQPGGHADGDANLAAVALREATEETGIDGLRVLVEPVDLDVHMVDPPAEHPHLHFDVRFLVLAPAGATVRGNHESTDLRWVAETDLVAPDLDADSGLLRLARYGFARARANLS